MFGVSAASANGLKGKLKLIKAAAQMPRFHPLGLLNKNRGVFGLNLGHMWHEPEKVATWMKVILEGVGEGWIRPFVDKAFPSSRRALRTAIWKSERISGKLCWCREVGKEVPSDRGDPPA